MKMEVAVDTATAGTSSPKKPEKQVGDVGEDIRDNEKSSVDFSLNEIATMTKTSTKSTATISASAPESDADIQNRFNFYNADEVKKTVEDEVTAKNIESVDELVFRSLQPKPKEEQRQPNHDETVRRRRIKTIIPPQRIRSFSDPLNRETGNLNREKSTNPTAPSPTSPTADVQTTTTTITTTTCQEQPAKNNNIDTNNNKTTTNDAQSDIAVVVGNANAAIQPQHISSILEADSSCNEILRSLQETEREQYRKNRRQKPSSNKRSKKKLPFSKQVQKERQLSHNEITPQQSNKPIITVTSCAGSENTNKTSKLPPTNGINRRKSKQQQCRREEYATEATLRKRIELSTQQQQQNRGHNAYENAIKEALDLLKRHQYNKKQIRKNSLTGRTVLAPSTIFSQTQRQKEPNDIADTGALPEKAAKKNIERLERKQRIAKYASQLAEIQQQQQEILTEETMEYDRDVERKDNENFQGQRNQQRPKDASLIQNFLLPPPPLLQACDTPLVNNRITLEDANNLSSLENTPDLKPQSFNQPALNEGATATASVEAPSAAAPAGEPTHLVLDEFKQQHQQQHVLLNDSYSIGTFSTREEEIQVGVERVLLAILERAQGGSVTDIGKNAATDGNDLVSALDSLLRPNNNEPQPYSMSSKSYSTNSTNPTSREDDNRCARPSRSETSYYSENDDDEDDIEEELLTQCSYEMHKAGESVTSADNDVVTATSTTANNNNNNNINIVFKKSVVDELLAEESSACSTMGSDLISSSNSNSFTIKDPESVNVASSRSSNLQRIHHQKEDGVLMNYTPSSLQIPPGSRRRSKTNNNRVLVPTSDGNGQDGKDTKSSKCDKGPILSRDVPPDGKNSPTSKMLDIVRSDDHLDFADDTNKDDDDEESDDAGSKEYDDVNEDYLDDDDNDYDGEAETYDRDEESELMSLDTERNDSLVGVLGPLSKKAGGTTGVVLSLDPPVQDFSAEPSKALHGITKKRANGTEEPEKATARSPLQMIDSSRFLEESFQSALQTPISPPTNLDESFSISAENLMTFNNKHELRRVEHESSPLPIDRYSVGGQAGIEEDDEEPVNDRLHDAFEEEARELMRTLCAHLLPFGVDKSVQDSDASPIPAWDQSNPNEAGYRIIRLTRSQLKSIEREFIRMVDHVRQDSERHLPHLADQQKKLADNIEPHGNETEYDSGFERDLEEAEDLLDREEQRYKAMASLKKADGSVQNFKSRIVSADNFSKSRSNVLNPPTSDDDPTDEKKQEPCNLSSAERADKEQNVKQHLESFPGVHGAGKGEMGDLEFFHLPIIYKSNVTGFEPTKDLYLEPGNVVAGQYLVENELGSAAFSTAYRCIDLSSDAGGGHHEEVCLKVIKNTKDFFDQSLDEIKILELLRQTGQCHENHIVEMKTFFYHREHLVIVTELLRQNLFEFGKFIVDNKEEPYFTLKRLCYITRQILISLRFVHKLGLVHSDVKPENILLGSYSRAVVKLIDFGSSCYLTDRQSSYIQSRSYRAPEVVLGLPYDGKIDIWSLGCVVAEMYTGEVTFQNDSIVSMLSRIEAICGPFPRHMIAQGRCSSRFFTKSGLLYEQVTDVDNPENSERNQQRTYPPMGALDLEDEEMFGPQNTEQDILETFDVFQPKRTTLSSRLGFDANLMEQSNNNAEEQEQAMFVSFVQRLLSVDPDSRPSAEEALEHPWIVSGQSLSEEDIKYPS